MIGSDLIGALAVGQATAFAGNLVTYSGGGFGGFNEFQFGAPEYAFFNVVPPASTNLFFAFF